MLNLLVEGLFGAVFLGALVSYLRRRDPLAREVALAFTGLALLLVVELVTAIVGELPAIVGIVAALLLLAQPVFTLRLLDRIRPLPRPLLPTAYAADGLLFTALLLLPPTAPGFLPLLLLAFGVFLVLETIAAGYLFVEARRRTGAARVRLAIAGAATALMAVAIFVLLAGALAPQAQGVADFAARVVALVAAAGYGAAFLPPPLLRRSWQAGASYRLGRRLLESADAADPHVAWQRFAELAAELTGAEGGVVRGSDGWLRASVGFEAPAVAREDVERLVVTAAPLLDRRVSEVGEPWVSVAKLVNARFISVVPIDPPGDSGPAVLLLYSRRRSLFGEDDRELLRGLGAQAAILADRAALGRDLRATVAELSSANAAKSDFLASMSHELRTPLNAIIGFSELMRTERPDGDRLSVPAEWVDHVANAGQHLLDLINDVLDLAKVEAGRLELDREPVDVDAAAREWVGGIRPLADRKGVGLAIGGNGGTVDADRGRLRQVVYNLLSNAIKFTPAGGEIRLELERTDSGLILAVADTGIGIAPEDHEAVFEEFRQVGRPDDRQPGTGLGLALTRRLVEAHGGRVDLESAPGVGSRFIVHLPQPGLTTTARPDLEPVAPSAGHEVDGHGDADVLVIEDDPRAVRLVRESLEGAGWRVRAAIDGPTGLTAARHRRPDAILLDVLLPGMDGWDVLRALKADADLRDVPVLMLTVVDEREVGLALGATDYLVKPVERAALLARLGRYTFTTKVREREVRVLVVDDDPATVEVMAEGLEQEGFVVSRAGGGRQAIELARERPPDVVVSDLFMPDLDGFALVRELKADSRTCHAPILVVTGHDLSVEDKARLNGDILGIVEKGGEMANGLRSWLSTIVREHAAGSPARATGDAR